MKNIKKHFKKIILIISIILFIGITLLVFNNQLSNIDKLIHTNILNIRTNFLTSIFLIITHLANAYFLITLSIILLIIIKNKKIPLAIIINLICSFTINELTKSIFRRPRPIGISLIEENGFSFPSGHSMVGMAFFGFITYLLYNKLKSKKSKILLVTSSTITILLIGFSRIYLGVHYLSDIIAGFLLSSIYLIIYITIIKKKKVI